MMESLKDFIKENASLSNKELVPQEHGNSERAFVGEAFSDEYKVNELPTDTKPEVIVLVGFPGVGKTSFVASFYQTLLQEGKIGDWECFDSDTFVGFEKRAFTRRLSEENTNNDTKRTIRGEGHILSLHFTTPNKKSKLVIISDRSGEDYMEYANKKDTVSKDILLQNADRVIFFVDSTELVDSTRLVIKQRITNLLINLQENEVFRSQLKVNVLFNKIDLIDDREAFEDKKSIFLKLFNEQIGLASIEFQELTSNRIDNNVELKKMFETIIDTSSHSSRVNNDNIYKELDWVKTLIKSR